MKLRTVGIVSKPKKEDICAVAPRLLDWFAQHNIRTICDQETAACLDHKDGVAREKLPAQVDLIVVLGGDGTLLATARLLEDNLVPVLAVNLGSLGFLTEITLDEVYGVLEEVQSDRHTLDRRSMLDARVERSGRAVAAYRALNDVVLHKAALARIVDFDVSIDGRFVSRIRSDGLILASPTGSTAYSLSAGGPIVLPSVESMIVTPIAPHMLTNRPLVIPGSARIQVQLDNPDGTVYVTVDGQVGEELHSGDCVSVQISERVIELVHSRKRDYFQVLRSKLRWGER